MHDLGFWDPLRGKRKHRRPAKKCIKQLEEGTGLHINELKIAMEDGRSRLEMNQHARPG